VSVLSDLVRQLTEDPNDPRVRLRRQLHDLEHTLSTFGHTAGRAGSKAAGEAGDVLEDVLRQSSEVLRQGTEAARVVGSQISTVGKDVGRQVARDPLPLLVAIGTIALVAHLVRR